MTFSAVSSVGTENFVLERGVIFSGVPLRVRLGVRSWGTLDAENSNAVLICHYYTGTAHAAGLDAQGQPGWWDALIGPGRAIDTEQYFVVCMNTPSNVQVHAPGNTTTGSDTLHPDGQPWGDRFPAWDFGDLHALQLELMRELGIRRWHAVIGPSLGGIQALNWAARSPELAPRIGAIVTSPKAGPVLRDVFVPMLRTLTHDDQQDETTRLKEALRLISFLGLGSDGMDFLFKQQDFESYLQGRMHTCSLAHVLDIARLVSTHDLTSIMRQDVLFERWRRSGLQLLTVNAVTDQFFPVAEMRSFASATQAAGVHHTHLEYDSPLGHLGCLQPLPELVDGLRGLLRVSTPEATAYA